jgi:predicted TIM-barrel fold metal-dependent hydrolase
MIIDSHTHIFPSFFSDKRDHFFHDEPAFELIYRHPGSKLAGRAELIRSMDEEEIDKSVIFGFPWSKEEHFKRHNDYILDSVARHPDRLIGLCCFSIESPAIARETERCLNAGLSGVGEIAVYHSGFSTKTIEVLKDVMALCDIHHVPILLHSNEPVGHQYPGKAPMTLRQIYDLLKSYPLNRIILAHWGGGIFFYSLMKKEVKDVLKNVWFDTAASPFLYSSTIYRLAGEIIGFDRILFGTDYPLIKPGRYYKEIDSSSIPPQAVKQILGDNAANLFSNIS